MRRSTSCCSVRSITPPPPRSRAPSWLTLFLHRHFALRVLVGGQFLGAGRIAIIAEEKGREVHIGLCAELAGPVWRHQGVDISEQRRDVARAPMLAEIRTLERGAAELAVVEGRAVTILAVPLVDRLAAFHLPLRECGRPLLPALREGLQGRDRYECDRSRRCGAESHSAQASGRFAHEHDEGSKTKCRRWRFLYPRATQDMANSREELGGSSPHETSIDDWHVGCCGRRRRDTCTIRATGGCAGKLS